MGKQKSFIIVGSSFLALILIIILVSVITRGLKDTRCAFDAENYPIEIGQTKALAPNLYAGGVVNNLDFEYTVDKEGIINIEKGTYSSGAAEKYVWVFSEINEEGKVVEQPTFVPHNEDDEITIVDGYWCINGEKTNCKPLKDYSAMGEDLNAYATRSVNPSSVNCFILNGIQTDIPYKKDIVPVRNEETKTWFIEGEDTKIKYTGIQVTITAQNIGSVTLTAKGIIDGKEVVASTVIQVCLPNPNSISHSYIDNSVVVNVNETFKLDQYEVNGKATSVAKPLQDVTYTAVGNPEGVTINSDGSIVSTTTGTFKVRIAVPRESFTIGIGKYESINTTITVIVLNTSEEQIDLINQAKKAISEIGFVENKPESIALVNAATEIVKLIEEANIVGITNYELYTEAVEKINSFNK